MANLKFLKIVKLSGKLQRKRASRKKCRKPLLLRFLGIEVTSRLDIESANYNFNIYLLAAYGNVK